MTSDFLARIEETKIDIKQQKENYKNRKKAEIRKLEACEPFEDLFIGDMKDFNKGRLNGMKEMLAQVMQDIDEKEDHWTKKAVTAIVFKDSDLIEWKGRINQLKELKQKLKTYEYALK